MPTSRESDLRADEPVQSCHRPVCAAGHAHRHYGSIVLRGQLPPEQMADSLRAVVRSIDPQLPLTHVESMEQVVCGGPGIAPLLHRRSSPALPRRPCCWRCSASTASSPFPPRSARMNLPSAWRSARSASSVMRLVLVSGAKLGLAGCAIGAIGAVFATRLLRTHALPGRSARPLRIDSGGHLNLSARARGIGRSRAPRGFH